MNCGRKYTSAGAAFAAWLAFSPALLSAGEAACPVPYSLVDPVATLARVTLAAKLDRRVKVLVVSGSPNQTGGLKGLRSYPLYFAEALRRRLPGVEVDVQVRSAARRTVPEVVAQLPALLSDTEPALVLWQAGTADAINGVHADYFAYALESGVSAILRRGIAVVLMDGQFSPLTDRLLSGASYVANMRRVADATNVPLFSRYEIMRYWNDSGIFDLTALRSEGLFEKVHGCVGQLLAEFIVRSAGLGEPESATR